MPDNAFQFLRYAAELIFYVFVYRSLLVHGFVVDEDGKKMSKSLGNVIDPKIILNGCKKQLPFGIDVMR